MAMAWKKERCPRQIWILYHYLSERNDQNNNDDYDTAMGHWSAKTECSTYNLKNA